MKKNKIWQIALISILFSLIFLTVKLDSQLKRENIIKLKMKKKIISNNLKRLNVEENKLMSKGRIEKIAIDQLGMHSPLPETLMVHING